MRIAGDEAVDVLEERLSHHANCRYVYISWAVPDTQVEREALVKDHSRHRISFEANGKEIFWEQTMRFEAASDSKDGRKHVIYKSTIMVDGVKKDIRAIKAAIKHIARDTPDAMRKTARLIQDGVL